MSASRFAGSTPVHVAIGFCLMGAWGVWANAAHGTGAALLAGLVQGSISGGLTFGLKRAVDWMRPRMRGVPAYVVPPLIAVTCSGLLLILAHRLAGTPELWMTIAVPLIVSSSYVFSYNILRQYRRERTPHD